MTSPSYGQDHPQHDYGEAETGSPRTERIRRKTEPLHSKYIKKRRPVRRGIKQRRTRRMMW